MVRLHLVQDPLSIIEPRQVFEMVSLYMDKSAGVCQSDFHDCKLSFLQIICDHDLFVEMTAILFRDFGRPPQRDATSLEQRVRRIIGGGEDLVIYNNVE
uniref:Uncharacterized protein n=1 Tax=Triticum urartu TaxID=4572 RepID=A0A8R7VB84_TRIUA